MGTVGYMSPEQVRGLPADHRTDIFAFGCVLYEMLSGRSPFGKETAAETMTAILHEDPQPLGGVGREVPAALEWIITRCLEKRPEDRFDTAHDVLIALETSARDAPLAVVPRPAPRARRHWWLGGAAIVALLAVLGGAWWWWRGQRGRALDPKRVVVAIFENQAGDPSLDALGKLAADSISEGLSRTGVVDVVPSSTVFGVARRGASGEKGGVTDPVWGLAEATGARLVVSGAYYVQGAEVRVHATITDAETGETTTLEPAVAARSEPQKAVDAIRPRVMGAIAVRFDTLFQFGSPGAAPDYRAYQEFLAGEELVFEDDAGARARFTRALEIDPTFVAARFAILWRAGGSKDTEAANQLAILETQREHLTPVQRRWLAMFRARVGGRLEEAVAAAREAVRLAPNDVTSVYGLAAIAGQAYHLREAIDILNSPLVRERFEAKTARGPLRWLYWWNLCLDLHFLGEDERALAAVRRGRTLNPDAPGLLLAELLPLAGLGRLDEIERVIDECSQMASPLVTRGVLMECAAEELRRHGRREAALRWATLTVEWRRGRPADEAGKAGARFSLAFALCLAERWDEARPLLEELARENVGNMQYTSWLGAVAARCGDRDEALRISEELRRVERPSVLGGATVARAEIAAQLGDEGRAVQLLREALAEGFPLNQLHSELRFEPLRGHPPFEELIKPKG